MPLLIKDVEWTETEQYVTIKLPLKGASTRNVDIFATNFYIKVCSFRSNRSQLFFQKVCKFHRKTTVLEPLFNKAEDPKVED